jgi:glycogen operon protein
MTDEDWCNPEMRCVGERLAGDAIEATDEHGNRIVDDTLLMLLNAHYESVPFVLPAHRPEQRWELVLDTQESSGRREHSPALEDDRYVVAPRSLVMLRIETSV